MDSRTKGANKEPSRRPNTGEHISSANQSSIASARTTVGRQPYANWTPNSLVLWPVHNESDRNLCESQDSEQDEEEEESRSVSLSLSRPLSWPPISLFTVRLACNPTVDSTLNQAYWLSSSRLAEPPIVVDGGKFESTPLALAGCLLDGRQASQV